MILPVYTGTILILFRFFFTRFDSLKVFRIGELKFNISNEQERLLKCSCIKIWNCYFKLKVNLKHSGSISRSTYLEYVIFDRNQLVNRGASFRWSFGPHSALGSIESTTIFTTHPSLQQQIVSNRSKFLIKNRPRTQFNPFWTHVRSFDLEETQLTLEHEI